MFVPFERMAAVGDEVTCPICLETLKKPIRILLCGHNLCQKCLMELCGSATSNGRCPSCREVIRLGADGPDGFPRNRTLEILIEKLTHPDAAKVNRKPVSSSSQQLLQMRDLASQFKEEKRYHNAIDILQIVQESTKGLDKVIHMIDLIECLLEVDRKEDATKVCGELVLIIDGTDLSEMKGSFDPCDKEIHSLAEAFLDIDYKVSITLSYCSFKLIRIFCGGKTKLLALRLTAFDMHKAAERMARVNKTEEFQALLPFMEEVLEEMQNMNEIDLQTKCLEISRCLNHLGSGCNHNNFSSQSIEFNKQAIAIMKTVFGSCAKQYCVFCSCYNNLAVAFFKNNQLNEAEVAYIQSQEFCGTALDWPNDHTRANHLSITSQDLAILQRKKGEVSLIMSA